MEGNEAQIVSSIGCWSTIGAIFVIGLAAMFLSKLSGSKPRKGKMTVKVKGGKLHLCAKGAQFIQYNDDGIATEWAELNPKQAAKLSPTAAKYYSER